MAREIKMLDVMFKDPTNTFKAGTYIEGRIYLDLNQEIKIKGEWIQTKVECVWNVFELAVSSNCRFYYAMLSIVNSLGN